MEQKSGSGSIISLVLAGLIGILLFAGCHRVNPTEVGFKISNAGDYRGIDTLPTVTGWVWTTPGLTYLVTLPTTQQHVVWSEGAEEGSTAGQQITVAIQGGASFKIDVGINYHINPFKASKIYLQYKTDDLDKITSTYIRNLVRKSMQDVSGIITVDSILNNLPGFEHNVDSILRSRLDPLGFVLDAFSIIHAPTPVDPNLAAAISAKIKAKQDVETSKTQLQQSIAESNKKIATARGDSAAKVINALADAEVIKVKTNVLSQSPQYIELIKAERWDGKLPQYVNGSGGNSIFTIK